MKKLVNGIVKFRREVRPEQRALFARLALGQKPDALYIGCSDSRVAVNVFASVDPGDLFVVRNVGNLVPPCDTKGISTGDESEASAIEFATSKLNVSNIIVCGHSECGAMQALVAGRNAVTAPNLRSWLRHGDKAVAQLDTSNLEPTLAPHDRLSQLNVMLQLEHLKTYPIVQERLKAGTLRLHGWWFELTQAEVYAYEEELKRFVVIDEAEADRILEKLG